jgi:2TM domain
MNEDTPRQYTADDVNRIIRRALKMETAESVSHEELLEMARELGVHPGKLEEAIKLEAAAMERERIRNNYLKRAQAAFKARLWGFLILNTFLFIIDYLTPGGWWFQWPLLGTGLNLAFSFKCAYFPTEERIRAAIRRHDRRKNRPHRRNRHAEI